MKHKIFSTLILMSSSLLITQNLYAGAGHSEETPAHGTSDMKSMTNMTEGKGHGHKQWVQVPNLFKNKSGGMTWMNKEAIEKGQFPFRVESRRS